MRDTVDTLLGRLDALTLRERAIVLAAGMFAIVMGWYMAWGEPELKKTVRLGGERQTLTETLEGLRGELGVTAPAASSGDGVQQRLQQVARRSDAVQGQIDDYAAELISPTQMSRVLEQVLERRQSLRLVRLANLGAEDLLPAEVPGEQRLYRHRFEMELEGPFLQCLSYLEDLEALPWRLYWQTLRIDADDYPSNRIRIEVATLSVHEDWIGV